MQSSLAILFVPKFLFMREYETVRKQTAGARLGGGQKAHLALDDDLGHASARGQAHSNAKDKDKQKDGKQREQSEQDKDSEARDKADNENEESPADDLKLELGDDAPSISGLSPTNNSGSRQEHLQGYTLALKLAPEDELKARLSNVCLCLRVRLCCFRLFIFVCLTDESAHIELAARV